MKKVEYVLLCELGNGTWREWSRSTDQNTVKRDFEIESKADKRTFGYMKIETTETLGQAWPVGSDESKKAQ